MPRSHARFFVFTAAALALPSAMALPACVPSYTFGAGGADGGIDEGAGIDSSPAGQDGRAPPGSDSSVDAPSLPNEASSDASGPDNGGPSPSTLVSAGSKTGALGYGYQTHVIYAQASKSFWLFYADDTPGVIETAVSPDFGTWTAATPIQLGGSYSLATDGSSFSVAYSNAGGHDVVHIVANAIDTSQQYMAFHIRATITGASITATSPIGLPDSTHGNTCPQDGPSTTVTPSGQIYDVTAWTSHPGTTCDTNVYLASGLETGASWSAGTFDFNGYYNSSVVYGFAHDLVSLPNGGPVLLLYPDYDSYPGPETNFGSIGWALSTTFPPPSTDAGPPVTAPQSSELFGGSGEYASFDDWNVCALTGSDVHVVRHVLASADSGPLDSWQEEVFNGSTWQQASGPSPVLSAINSGTVLVSDTNPGHGMLLATVTPTYAIDIAKWTSTGGWTHAGAIPSTSNPRQSLVGSGCGSARPSVLWTETIGSANEIMAADLATFLQ